ERVALGYKGSAWAEVTLTCPQTHTASGQQTAAEAAVAFWLAVKDYTETFNAGRSRVFDQLLPTLRHIEAGEDGFKQWARLRLGCRLPVEVAPEDWYAILRQTSEVFETAEVRITPVGYPVPAYRAEKNTPLVRAFLGAIRTAGGRPGFVFKTGTADLNIVAPVWNCPAVVYGPGDSALDHTPHEHLELQEYQRAVQVLRQALIRLTANTTER
ncbi:MAG: M20/M25/M40 family metallo-hydrolase, partial [Anaerolineae bacterium]